MTGSGKLACPKCGSEAVYSWCGELNTVKYHDMKRSDGTVDRVPVTSSEDVGASLECGDCGYRIQGRPGETLRDVTPRWRAEQKAAGGG